MEKTKKYYKRCNRIASTVFDSMQRKISSQIHSERENHPKSYWFIPHDTAYTIDQLILVHDYIAKAIKRKLYSGQFNFLDAGCGTGNILLLAAAIGFNVKGLEHDSKIIKLAKIINPLYNDIKKQDILTYKEYGKFDVIYYYRPFRDNDKQTEFERLVENQMKIGSLLIANCKQNIEICKDKRFRKIKKVTCIFEKIAE